MHDYFSRCGWRYTGQDFEQGGLAGAVSAYDAYDFAGFHFKIYTFEGPKIFFSADSGDIFGFLLQETQRILENIHKHVAQSHIATLEMANVIFLADVFYFYDGFHDADFIEYQRNISRLF